MKFNIINNHILVTVETDLGNKQCVFDTGSPFTFFFNNVSEYSIDGRTFKVFPNPMTSMLALKNSEVGISFIEGCFGVN